MKIKLVLFGFSVVFASHISSAQVFDSNGNGYINITLKPGFNLIANPLLATNNSLGALFTNIQGGVPPGTTIHKLTNGAFLTIRWDDLDNQFVPTFAATTETTLPGEGVYVFLPGTQDKVLTFVGQIAQGEYCTDIPRGYSVKSSTLPMDVNLDQLGFPHTDGDQLYLFNVVTRSFFVYLVSFDNAWDPPLRSIRPAEAFLLFRVGPAVRWCRTFSLPPP